MHEDLRNWLNACVELGASDLHLASGDPPMMRLNGVLQTVAGADTGRASGHSAHVEGQPLSGERIARLLEPICIPENWDRFQTTRDIDFSWELPIGQTLRRFRVNLFFSRRHPGACFRIIPAAIPDFGWSGFPEEVAYRLAHFRNGLVLLSGVAGSGKTTTLAMIINLLNEEGGKRIITIEEPVEYIFPRCTDSIVTQREVGVDVRTFADGLKYGVRQDPDVLLVGEIRDSETAQMALSAAETGHLVFSTLHTRDAKGAISRYADLFPQAVQNEVRAQLSMSLRAVITQHLLPSSDPRRRRELALEILFNNSPVASAIRLGKLESIDTAIVTGRAEGMLPLDESIRQLLHARRITRDVALHYVSDPARFKG